MLAPMAAATSVWPRTADASDLQQVVWEQAKTMAEQNDLIVSYQTILENAQAIPPATGVGNSTGTTSLTLTGVTGIVKVGAVVTGTGVPAGLTIMSQTSGSTGGNGVYVTNAVSTLGNIALTFTPGGGNSPWPPQTDAPDLLEISQRQNTILRSQNALISQYVDLLNVSSTAPPP